MTVYQYLGPPASPMKPPAGHGVHSAQCTVPSFRPATATSNPLMSPYIGMISKANAHWSQRRD